MQRWNVNLEYRSLLRERTQGDRKPDKPRMRYGSRSLLDRKPDKPRMRYGLVGHERRGMSHETSGRASEFYSKRTFASIRCLPSAAASSEWLHTPSKSACPDSPLFSRSIPTVASVERCDSVFVHCAVFSAIRRSILQLVSFAWRVAPLGVPGPLVFISAISTK